ncbi:MAG TPA: phosphotransferase [Actinopolymorphaceae bacterium]|nr:phosphotransferase [Actinopolymorphaceae bacterium]
MGEQRAYVQAKEILAGHGYETSHLGFVGAGAQSVCYGTRDVAVLLSRADVDGYVADLTGHVVPDRDDAPVCNSYAVLQWLTTRAVEAGVRTPRILAIGDVPRPYALMQRAYGTPAADHPRSPEHAVAWFAQLGAQIRTTNLVETTGFGMFVPDGSGGYRGRFATWTDYLDRWLGVHLCRGQSRPEDRKVLDLLLSQGIVTERDFETLESKVREAQEWPVRSALTHYDNRLDNLVVDAGQITVLDWGLSLAGIGTRQELIKLFETGLMSMENPRVAAFLHGYGLSEPACVEAIEGAKLMLVLDGVAMSYGWAERPERLGGVEAWLRTVKRICGTW